MSKNKTIIIAEAGVNHNGNIKIAKKLVDVAKISGADYVKFQMWRAEDIYEPTDPDWNEIKKSELNNKVALELKNYADEIGIKWFCSVFYPEAVDLLESLNVKKYKIASRTCLFKDTFSLETLTKKSLTKKPVIISMGMGGNKEKIKKLFSKNQITFCYCISEYPAPFKKINWKKAINYEGFSDHTLGIIAPIIFSILKKQNNAKNIIIEKHVKLNNSKGPDASSSIDTDELKQLVHHIRNIEKIKF